MWWIVRKWLSIYPYIKILMSFLILNLFIKLLYDICTYVYRQNRDIHSNCSWEHIFRVLFRIKSIKKTCREMSSIEIYARAWWRVKLTWITSFKIAYLVLLRHATKFRICSNRQELKMFLFLFFLFFHFFLWEIWLIRLILAFITFS